jgi:hypothetical protein
VRRLAFAALLLLVAACSSPPDEAAGAAAPAPAAAKAPRPTASTEATGAPDAAEAPRPAVVPAPYEDPRVDWQNRLAHVSSEAKALVDRVQACTHFAGEFNGDGSQRDHDVAMAFAEHHCDTIDADLAAGRARWRDDPAVLALLDAASRP